MTRAARSARERTRGSGGGAEPGRRDLPFVLAGLILGLAVPGAWAACGVLGPEDGDPTGASRVEVWGRHRVELRHAEFSGNPFEIELEGFFTHARTGTQLALPGYYDGEDRFEILFMPTLEGEWTYLTRSDEPALDGARGRLVATRSADPGFLGAAPGFPDKWKLSEGPFVVPIGVRIEFFTEPADRGEFAAAADLLAASNVQLVQTQLTQQPGLFGPRGDFIFEGDWRDHRFDLTVWDRMEERMEMLAARGLGAHIALYSDDAGAPGWSGRSPTEELVVRYVVARLAPYPRVLFNTGIDVIEFRSQADIDWLGRRLRSLDPYGHPVSSRRFGGSGALAMADRTFESFGDRTAEMPVLLSRRSQSSLPFSMDDAWPEDNPNLAFKSHTPQDIRRAVWKLLVAGGGGGLLRGGADGLPIPTSGVFSIHTVRTDWESEQWVAHLNPFLGRELGEVFGDMQPASGLVGGTGAFALADPGRRRIVYLYIGPNDTYDAGSGDLTVRLGAASGSWDADWFDPRAGSTRPAGTLAGGRDHPMSPPTQDDWVLLLRRR